MVDRLFPQQFDNTYRGHRLGVWLFGLVVAVMLLQSVVSVGNASMVLRSADGIPLDTYEPAGAQTIVALFALLGFAHGVTELLCLVALVRYKSAVPMLFCLLLFARLGSKVVLRVHPIVRVGAPPGVVVNLVILGVLLLGLVLSLVSGRQGTAVPWVPKGTT